MFPSTFTTKFTTELLYFMNSFFTYNKIRNKTVKTEMIRWFVGY